MYSNLVRRLLRAAWVLELVVAVLILTITLLGLFPLGEGILSQVLGGSFSADTLFADAMAIVVGIEFVKILVPHTPRAVTDVLLFAIARQLVVNYPSAVDTLPGVTAVALILVIKKFLRIDGDDAPAEGGCPRKPEKQKPLGFHPFFTPGWKISRLSTVLGVKAL